MRRHEMSRYEIYAQPQGDAAEAFPDVVVAVIEGQVAAARKAWELQMETTISSCLYGIRQEAA